MKILFGLSVLPAIIIIAYIRSKDKIEKEPAGLLISLFLLGVLSIIPAIVIGIAAEEFAKEYLDEESSLYVFLNAFFMVGFVEEGGKFVMLRLRTWKHPAFDYTFDAIVYAVTVSLGFATFENILYVMSDGTMYTAILRGVLSVPGHAINAVFMGYYYGLAKKCEYLGDYNGKIKNLFKSWIVASIIHGFYDFCLMIEKSEFIVIFFIFEIFITIYTIRKIRKLSREDSPLGPPLGVAFNSYQQYYQQNPYYYNSQKGCYESYANNPYYYSGQQQQQQQQYQYSGANSYGYTAQQNNAYSSPYQQQTGSYSYYDRNNYGYTQQQGYNYNDYYAARGNANNNAYGQSYNTNGYNYNGYQQQDQNYFQNNTKNY